MIQGYHAYSLPMLQTGLPATFPLLGLFCAVCFGLFCLCVFSLVWFCFSVFVLWRNCDGIGLCIGPPPVYFCGHSISRRPSLRQLINSLISANMQSTCWTTWRKPRGVGREKKGEETEGRRHSGSETKESGGSKEGGRRQSTSYGAQNCCGKRLYRLSPAFSRAKKYWSELFLFCSGSPQVNFLGLNSAISSLEWTTPKFPAGKSRSLQCSCSAAWEN